MKSRLVVDGISPLAADAGLEPTRRTRLQLTGAGLSLIAVCYGLARFAYGLFVPMFRAEFALDSATAGAIAAGSYASFCVAIVVSTVATPRFGGRALAVAAGVIATGGTLTIAAAPTPAVLAVGVLVAGSSTGMASPPLAHAVAHRVAESMRNRTQAIVNAGTGFGVAAAGPVALATHEDWRAAWLAFAAVSALVTVGVGVGVPAGPTFRGGSRGSVFPRPYLPAGSGRLVAAAGLMGGASAAVWTFGRDLLVGVGGLDGRDSTIAWMLLGGFGVLGAAAGDVVNRFGIRAGWPATMLAMALATGLWAASPGSLALAWAAAAAFGSAYIVLPGLLLIWGTRVYPRTPAAAVGVPFLVIALGQALGAPAVGVLSGVAGPRAAFAVAALVATAGGLVRPRRPDPVGGDPTGPDVGG